MFELFALALVIWVIYCFATGKFSKENQEKNKQEFDKSMKELKDAFNNMKSEIKTEEVKKTSSPVFSKKGNNLKTRITITYKDYDGDESYRTIQPERIYKDGKFWYIDAFCESAQAERTFRSDRIIDLMNLKTNEFMSNQTAIRAYIRELGKTGVF